MTEMYRPVSPRHASVFLVREMLIDSRTKALVLAIEERSEKNVPAELNLLLTELITRLHNACARPENQARYTALPATSLAAYPLDDDGYAQAFDPLEDEAGFVACWQRYGMVVSRRAVPTATCTQACQRMGEIVHQLSHGACQLDDPASWAQVPRDPAGAPLFSRGFFEVYHDAVLAELRQAVRVYLHHVLIWGRADLWTSFDRLGLKLPDHEESYGLPLHVDQNPLVHPDFRTVQGVLALADCPLERGTFLAVPGSRQHFPEYAAMATNRGEFVQLDTAHPIAATLAAQAQALPLRAGDLVSWDSRTTHANTANLSSQPRFVAYLAAGPVPAEKTAEQRKIRQEAYTSGLGSNVREALLHASKKPRFTAPEALRKTRALEQLTLLGELLYGEKSYASLPPLT